MDVVRITELQPKTYVEQGDYIAIDNQSDGTKKVQFTNLLDDTLSQENKIAPANVVGNEIATVRDEVEDEIATIRAAVGSPLKASTVAQMTDKNKIYVYVGSESGYTNGNWYYWNGSAWVSGGVYNSVAVVTDPTLTLSGVPADAKATGDKVTNLQNNKADNSHYFNLKWTEGKCIGVSGNIQTISGVSATYDYYPVQAGDVLHMKLYAPGSTDVVALYDTSKNLITTFTVQWNNTPITYVVPNNGYMRFSNEQGVVPNANAYVLLTNPKYMSIEEIEKELSELSIVYDVEKQIHLSSEFYYDLNWTDGRYIGENGGVGESSAMACTLDYYPVYEGQTLKTHLSASGINECIVAFYDSNKSFLSFVKGNGIKNVSVEHDGYARFSTVKRIIPVAEAYVLNILIPVENGYFAEQESLVEQNTEFIFLNEFTYPLVFTNGGYINTAGGVTPYANSKYTADYYRVNEGQKLKILLYAPGTSDVAVAYYRKDKSFLSSIYSQQTTEHIIEVPSNAYFARFSTDVRISSIPYVKNYVEKEETSLVTKPYYPSSFDELIVNENTVDFEPSTLPLDYKYKGEINNEKRFLAIGFDDFRVSDFSMIIPLFDKYNAKAEFNRVANSVVIGDSDTIKINNVIYGGHELGDHTWLHYNYPYTLPLFNGQNPASLEGSQQPYPTNSQMRDDRGDGKNALGRLLSDSANISTVTTNWGNLSDEECQTIREYYCVMKDNSLCNVLDTLSNKYLGTTGASRGSWNNTLQQYTGGIFTGCKTSENHEIWERILMVTKMFYKDQYGLNWNFKTWSWPGSKGDNISFEYNGLRYYDPNFTQFINYLAKFESSLYKDETGNAKIRSWNDVLDEFGYFGTHDSVYPGRMDGQSLPIMSNQLVLNADLSRPNAIIYPTNRTISYGAIASEYPESFFSNTKSKAAQMYDSNGSFRTIIESMRTKTSCGIIHGEVIDSENTYSERIFLEEVLKYCKTVGVEVITKAQAYDVCFNHRFATGNLMYNPRLRNTAKEFMPDAENVPTNPDGYSGNCLTYMDEDGVNVLQINGNTYHSHYGIPLGKLKFSAEVKGTGSVIISSVANKNRADGSESESYPVLGRIDNNTNNFTEASVEFIVPEEAMEAYEQRCAGYGNKITGLLFKFTTGIEIKNMRLETI